jgi:hypothetical protein
MSGCIVLFFVQSDLLPLEASTEEHINDWCFTKQMARTGYTALVFRSLQFVAIQPVLKFSIGIAFHRHITNQSSDKVLAVKSALASTFVDADTRDGFLYFFARDYHL